MTTSDADTLCGSTDRQPRLSMQIACAREQGHAGAHRAEYIDLDGNFHTRVWANHQETTP